MEVWKEWNPWEKTIYRGALEIINDVEALNIIFKQKDGDIVAQYTGGWFSYKATISKFFEKKIEHLKQQKNINIPQDRYVFKVENADYRQWLREESYGIYEYGNFKIEHFVYVGSNIVFEVLATCDPKINIISR